jgi:hypothetical protein
MGLTQPSTLSMQDQMNSSVILIIFGIKDLQPNCERPSQADLKIGAIQKFASVVYTF